LASTFTFQQNLTAMKIKSQAVIAFFLFLASVIHAQQGQLDNSFGVNGIVKQSHVPPFPSGNNPNVLTLLDDGKFMVAADLDFSMAFYRFEKDGSLDTSFGDSGVVQIEMGWLTYDIVKSVIVQPDGSALALMQSNRHPDLQEDWSIAYVMRFNPDWELDSTFGHFTTYAQMGLTEVKTGFDVTEVSSFQLLQDGKMLISGKVRGSFNSNVHTFVAKLNADGTFDNSFGSNGLVFPSWNNFTNGFSSLTLQPDDKLILSGWSRISYDTTVYAIARLNNDGTIDSSFGVDGLVAGTLPSANYYVQQLFLQEDGKILAWINGDLFPPLSLDVIRLNPDGSFDNSFGTDGTIHIPNDKVERISRILVDDEGSFFLAGYRDDSTYIRGEDFALAKLSSEFNWVEAFGDSGVTIIKDTSNTDILRTARVLPDGKVLLAGTASPIYYITNLKLVKIFGRDTLMTTDTTTIPPQDSLLLNENGLTILPNPVGEDFQICYPLEERSIITIDLFNSVGELLYSFLTEEVREEGVHCEQFIWPKDIIDKGVYFVRLQGRNFAYSAKILKP
jgi:uncharacterized delta-60 repeat protein